LLANKYLPSGEAAVGSGHPVTSQKICEIRVPTYRRPRLLERALRSIIEQTDPNWRCLVFDDCPEGSARPTVEQIADARIQYRKNPTPLRAIGNIDQCFRNRPYCGGQYACVVEDDNYLLPHHIRRQFEACERWSVDVTFSAQACERVVEAGQPGFLDGEKTIAWIYPEGRHDFTALLPAILFSHAFSNGSVFWRLGCESDFEIGALTVTPGVQEMARILRLRNTVYMSHAPSSVWRWNDPKDSHVNAGPGLAITARAQVKWHHLLGQREVMELRRAYLRAYGLHPGLAFADSQSGQHKAAIESNLLMCGRYARLTERPALWRIAKMLRGMAFRMVVPCRMADSLAPGSDDIRERQLTALS
jgi:Glycosyl transferase family 2